MAGRFLPQRDLNVFERVNKELIGDLQNGKDGIINQQVVLYKVSVQDTQTNMMLKILTIIMMNLVLMNNKMPHLIY